MDTVQFSVHEFMVIMGNLSEYIAEGGEVSSDSIWHLWQERYKELDRDLEKLDMMQRADMLFDGKVTFRDVPLERLQEVMGLVDAHLAHEQKLVDDNDVDADPEEVEIWRVLRLRLETSLEAG